jgi:LPS-assembly lipoprotein
MLPPRSRTACRSLPPEGGRIFAWGGPAQKHSAPVSLMHRRSFAIGAAALAGSLLAGCGFKLRGEQNFSFETISVVAAQGGPVAVDLRRVLGARVRELPAGRNAAANHVMMDIINEQREKTVVGVNAAGQVREFQLRIRVSFRLRNSTGKELIAATEILQQRDISFNESAVLAKESEEALLYRDMQNDIVQQLMRRLAAVQATG